MRMLIVPALFAAALPLLSPHAPEESTPARPAPIAEIAPPQAPAPAQATGEGYDLFSWQVDGQWRFALQKGHVKRGAARESAPADAALSLKELKQALRDLPAGEHVRWSLLASVDANNDLAFPDDALLEEIQKACDAARVKLIPLHC